MKGALNFFFTTELSTSAPCSVVAVDGHDSQEDAAACMELMLWRVREDLKKGVR